eukprot:GFKZ01001487.1.p1 GENE.GFKZ01001487.1~~GFKZ01001487.1.p1  ORF type:complete len:2018 (-),score=174.68 GFKZ01001487.1:559-6612(-)
METRGRGRNAASTEKANPPHSPAGACESSSSVPGLDTRTTRSRSKNRLSAARAQSSSRTSNSSGAVANFKASPQIPSPTLNSLAANHSSLQFSSTEQLPGSLHTHPLADSSSTRYRGKAVLVASTDIPAPRKRTRSSAKKPVAQSSKEGLHSEKVSGGDNPAVHPTGPASSSAPRISALLDHRPLKRSRLPLAGGPDTQDRSTVPTSAPISRPAPFRLDREKMDPDGSRDRSTARNLDGTDQQGGNIAHTSAADDHPSSNTIHGLLRRLGADLNDMFPRNTPTSHSRLQQLRLSLSSPASDGHHLEALSELCEFLSVATEESLVSFSINLYVPILVDTLRNGGNTEIKILAARALTHMMEALPSSSSSIAGHGGAGPLCQNLLAIEYIDLAEQSLYALRKLSIDYPQVIVTANGFRAVLSFIDFFSIGVQRVAAETACNLCRLFRADVTNTLADVLPIMSRLIESEDQRIRESMVLGIRRLAESLQGTPSQLEALCEKQGGLVRKVLAILLSSSTPPLATSSQSSAFRFLAIIARGNADVGLQIMSTPALMSRLSAKLRSTSATDALDCLSLADCLLPNIPELDSNVMPTRSRRRPYSSNAQAVFVAVDERRREQLVRNPAPLVSFGQSLFPNLMKFFCSTAEDSSRRSVLNILSKFIAVSPANVLRDALQSSLTTYPGRNRDWSAIHFSPFVARLLQVSSSQREVLVGLAIADATLRKVPLIRESFVREGVVHEFSRIALCRDGIENVRQEGNEGCSSSFFDEQIDYLFEQEGSSLSTIREGSAAALPGPGYSSVWSVVAAKRRGNGVASTGGDLLSAHQKFRGKGTDLQFTDSEYQEILPSVSRMVLANHFEASSNNSMDISALRNSRLEKLRTISQALKESSGRSSEGEVASGKALSDLVAMLSSPGNLSVFEFSKGGVIQALSEYLTPSDYATKSRRISSLCRVLDLEKGTETISSLVYLSLGALSFEEGLSAKRDETPRGDMHVAMSSGLRQLAQPLKLRLKKSSADTATSLLDYSQHVVLIEPLATMASIEEFLWPRVGGSERSRQAKFRSKQAGESGTESDGARSLSGDDEDAKEGDGPTGRGDNSTPSERESGPVRGHESFSADELPGDSESRAHAGNHERPLDLSDEDNSSAEGDVIGHASRDDDGHGRSQAELDVDQIGSSLSPLELDLEVVDQAPAGYASTFSQPEHDRASRGDPFAHQSASTSRSFRSYAAALVANVSDPVTIGPGPDVGARSGSRRPGSSNRGCQLELPKSAARLSFSCNGRTIARNSSILSAVIKGGTQRQGIGRHIWYQVHTLVYEGSKLRTDRSHWREPAKVAGSSSTHRMQRSNSGVDRLGGLRRSQRLIENRKKMQGDAATQTSQYRVDVFSHKLNIFAEPNPLPLFLSDMPASTVCTLEVLNHLNWILTRWRGQVGSLQGKSASGEPITEKSGVQFHSTELSARLIWQISDPLILCGDAVPNWCFSLSRGASFLIPFETRKVFFQSTSLGLGRALHLLQARVENLENGSSFQRVSQGQGENETRIERIRRQKVRIHREQILESAIKVMNLYAKHSTLLEVQFFHEVGTGIGPTLEFYTLASRELQREDLSLWRCAPRLVSNSDRSKGKSTLLANASRSSSEECALLSAGVKRRRKRHSQGEPALKQSSPVTSKIDQVRYVVPPGNGLFPSCLSSGTKGLAADMDRKNAALFEFVGRLIGKALLDGRLLDLRISRTLSTLILAYCRVYDERSRSSISLDDAGGSGEASWKFWRESLDNAARMRVWEVFISGTSALELLQDVDQQLAKSLSTIMGMIRGGQSDSIASMCLTFVLPGDDNYELIRNGADVEVTGKNAEDFVQYVLYHVLYEGVQQQVEAMLQGMNEIFDIRGLLSFQVGELEMLICGPSFEKWSVDFLVRATLCDHGYSHESPAVLNFLQVLSEMTRAEQQRFVMFATGSPALPVGGLLNLRPPLTIVRRTPEAGRSPDESLPTVMTCTNYFKLPDYSSMEITRKQVMYAILEGQGAFHLS